jgi:intracellular sulfur oxidation DsrE/DsrF family protein
MKLPFSNYKQFKLQPSTPAMKGTHMNTQEKTLHIDIPVKLTEVKVVFSIASLSFEGDLPASLFHLQLIVNDISDWKATSQVVAVFHTNAGHVTLHDQAYNHDRNIATGNPFKKLVTDLMERGVQVELCGATAKFHGYGNADLIPGININTDAMARTTQLVQEGFIKISES